LKHSRIVTFILLCSGLVWGQGWHNHPELEWQTFETEHFLIHFHQGTERSAREAATVAEKVYGPITQLYRYEPPAKTHLIIKDVDDVSNGMAYYFDNKIEIWARPLDFDLRGSHRWMQNVIPHEFAHIIQLATAMKFSARVPGAYFQLIGYEDEKREDVLYGYPNVLVSYPYPGVNIPPWFAEGVAQYMYPGANYDFWDTHRDMILRDRTLHNKLLSFTAMNTFGKRGIGNESTYNQGFAFVSYLANRFGDDVLLKISRQMAAPFAVSISRAIKKATGFTGQRLYRDWVAELNLQYAGDLATVQGREVKGEVLLQEGTANLHPVWHPTDRKFALLSNRDADYFGQTDLYIYDFAGKKKLKKVAAAVNSAPLWSPDGNQLYYARRSPMDRTGARWLDLFVYDLGAKKEDRLTHGERATAPVWIDEETIAYLTVYDGVSNIKTLQLPTGELSALTSFEDGYIHSLAYSPADSTLIFDATINHGRDLHRLNLATGASSLFVPGGLPPNSDLREPGTHSDGVLLSTDASGVFNLFRAADGGVGDYITNVAGGAFMPSVNEQGEVLYSLYEDGGYRIAYLAQPQPLDREAVGISPDFSNHRPDSPLERPDRSLQPQSYQEAMSKPFLLPRLMVDYGTLKPGLFFYANEVLNRLFLFGGASANRIGDTDYFLIFEFNKFRPTLFAELYAVQRHVRQGFTYYDYHGTNDLRFNLMEAILGARLPVADSRLWVELDHSRYRERVSQKVETLSGAFSFDYYIGTALTARWKTVARRPEYGGNMFPTSGYDWQVEARLEKNDLVGGFGIDEDYGTLRPQFTANNTLRLTAEFRKYLPLKKSAKIGVAYEARIGWLSNRGIDDFFYFFGGGLPGLRGYTYYDSTSQGTNLMLQTVTLRVPLFLEEHLPLLHLILQRASIGCILQVGDAFNGDWIGHPYKTSAGLELRLSGHNFYVFPFALGYEIHRPLSGKQNGFRQYFSLLFDF